MKVMHHRNAFTLLELTVVIAIIALLTSLMLMGIRLVRDAAYTITCASNLRQVGMYMGEYANRNEGHYPGGCLFPNGATYSWCDILNFDLLNEDGLTLIGRSDTPGTRALSCQEFKVPQTSYFRCYAMNMYAAGSFTLQYATVVPPAELVGSPYAGSSTFYLGAPHMRFSNQSSKVLLQEIMFPADTIWACWPYGVMNVTDAGTYKYASGGCFAFRHNKGTVANFLFMDLHTEAQHPSGSLNIDERYNF